MKHVKKMASLLVAMVVIVVVLSTTATAQMSNPAPTSAAKAVVTSTACTEVVLIPCMSASTHWVEYEQPTIANTQMPIELPLLCASAYSFSSFPGTVYVPTFYAYCMNGYDYWAETNPDEVVFIDSQFYSGLLFDDEIFLYPFRELAESLDYDVLWKNIDGVGYVFFAPHVKGGIWIHLDVENLIPISGIETTDRGWTYANSVNENGDYNVQLNQHSEVTVPASWVTEAIPVN